MIQEHFKDFPRENPPIDQMRRDAFKLPDSFAYRLPPKKISKELLQEGATQCAVASPASEIFSSVDGRIKLLLVTYPVYGKQQLIYERTLSDLLSKMPGVDFLIFTQYPPGIPQTPSKYRHVKAYLAAIKRQYATDGRQINFIRSGFPHFTCWVRDPFLVGYVASDDGKNLRAACIEPVGFLRENADIDGTLSSDAQIAEEIVQQSGHQFALINAPLVFHGGNVLAGDDFILIGKDYYRREQKVRKMMASSNISVPGISASTRLKDIQEDFQEWLSPNRKKRILVLGKKGPKNFLQLEALRFPDNIFERCPVGKRQPFFHLDLFLTLAGRHPDTGAYQILVAQVEDASGLGYAEVESAIIKPWNTWINHIAKKLQQNGFEVIPMPMPLVYGEHRDYKKKDWFVLSYNNCLVEISQSGKKVWMPTYGTPLETHKTFKLDTSALGDFDRRAEQRFRDLGFEVQPLMNYLPHMLYGGAVHCLTNCLWREP